jgi:hypothetical protein
MLYFLFVYTLCCTVSYEADLRQVKNVVKGLENGKSSGIDGVINEYIKYTIDDMLHIYVLLFFIMLSVNFFCNISSYDILAKNYNYIKLP